MNFVNFRTILCLFCLLLTFSPKREFIFGSEGTEKIFLPNLTTNALINAYFTGKKKGLPKDIKRAHQTLNLQHLMTPSGLHLASFVLVLGLFIKKRTLIFLSLTLLGFLLLPYSGIDSLKRMILFGVLRKNPIKEISLKHSFILTFVLAFITGQYFENPLSFSLSFVFIGALIYTKNRLLTFVALLSIQALLSHWLNKSLDPLGATLGLLLSLVSPLLFPLFGLELLWQKLPFSGLWTNALTFFSSLCVLPLRLPFFSLFPLMIFFPKKKLRIPTTITCFLFFVAPLGSFKKYRGFPNPPPPYYKEKVALKNGTKFLYEDGMRCYSRLKGDQWSHHCYK
jgi:hypothetical protein